MFENLFFPENSPMGWQKKALLCNHRIICLDQPNLPPYRASWEMIQGLISEHHEDTIRQMRLCAVGSELADEYAKVVPNSEWGVHVVFNKVFPDAFVQAFPEWDKRNGMDADIFLLIDDENHPVFHLEFFPREVPGQISTAFGSKMRHTVPFVTSRDKEIIDDLGGIIFAGVGTEGERFEEAVDRWVNLKRGMWKIIEKQAVMMFMHSACFSDIEYHCPEAKPVVSAGFARSIHDRSYTNAVFRYTASK